MSIGPTILPSVDWARAWLVIAADVVLKATALLLVVALLAPGLRRASAALRHLLWLAGVGGVLLIPVLSWVLPAWRVLPGWAMPAMTTSPSGTGGGAGAGGASVARVASVPPRHAAPQPLADVPDDEAALSGAATVISAHAPPAPPATPGPEAGRVPAPMAAGSMPPLWELILRGLPLLWVLGAAAVALPLLLGMLSLHRLARSAQRPDEPAWALLLDEVAARLKLGRPVHLRLTASRTMPLIYGTFRPCALLPLGARAWSPPRRRLVLLHELAHVKRWDCLTQLVARLACVVYWFHPLAHLAARRMQVEREQACDDLVLGSGSGPQDYARELVEVTAWCRDAGLAGCAPGTVAMARSTKLEARLRAILETGLNRRPVTRRTLLTAAVLLAAVAVPLAMLRSAKAEDAAPSPRPAAASVVTPMAAPSVAAPAIAASPATSIKRGVPIMGMVRGRDGKPIAGARAGYGSDRTASNAVPEVTTDAQGRFVMGGEPGAKAVVTVQAAGYAPQVKSFVVGEEQGEVTYDLQPAQALSGRVTDGAGKPVGGATVFLDSWRGMRTLTWSVATSANGQFSWADAPADEVRVDVLKPGFTDERGLAMRAGAENMVVLHRPTVVRGTVVDAETGQPVKGFRLTLGILFQNGDGPAWQRRSGQRYDDRFELSLTFPQPAYVVQVEAEGYLPADSQPIKTDGQERNLTFKLVRGKDLAGVLLAPDGTPRRGATVLIVDRSGSVQVINGEVSQFSIASSSTTTDREGKFHFSPQTGSFVLLVTDDEGFARVSDGDFKKNPKVQLQAWGEVEGVLKVGTKPGVGQTVELLQDDEPERPKGHQIRIFTNYSTKTDGTGHFHLKRVQPGQLMIGRSVELSPNLRTWAGLLPVVVEAGKTRQVMLGGTGRPVVGRVVLPAGVRPGMWSSNADIVTKVQGMASLPAEALALDPTEWIAWFAKWKQTPEGKAFVAEGEKEKANRKSFPVVVAPDGRLRAEEVPAGTYVLDITLMDEPENGEYFGFDAIASAKYDFTMPSIPGGVSDEPLVLPPIALHPEVLVRVGDAAPDFSVKSLNDGDVRLGDLKGKYVLLEFWATWAPDCDAEVPILKAVYETFGKDPRFTMIGLSQDNKIEKARKAVEAARIPWRQGFVGMDWRAIRLPDRKTGAPASVGQRYGVQRLPSIWLIGPDGKVIAKGLRGRAIKDAVERALRG